MASCQPKWKQIGCLQRALVEQEANFKVVEIASLSGERILSGIDAAIFKIEYLQLLPQIFQFILQIKSRDLLKDVVYYGKGKSLLLLLGEDFVKDLVDIARYNKIWSSSKNGNVKKLSSPANYNWKRKKEERDGEVLALDEDDGPVADERGHETCLVNPNGMSMSPSPSKNLFSAFDNEGFATSSKKMQDGDVEIKKIKPAVSLVSTLLKKDKSRRKFLQDLLNSRIFTDEENRKGKLVDDDNDKKDDSFVGKKSVVKLLKVALKGRYATHVRKCLKDRDLKSLLCILTIVAETPENETEYGISEETRQLQDRGRMTPTILKVNPEDSSTEAGAGTSEVLRRSLRLSADLLQEQSQSDSSGNDDVMRMVFEERDPETLLKSAVKSENIIQIKDEEDRKQDELFSTNGSCKDEIMPIYNETIPEAGIIAPAGSLYNQSLDFPLPESDISFEICSKFSTSKDTDSESSYLDEGNKIISVSTELSPERLDRKSLSGDVKKMNLRKSTDDSISSSIESPPVSPMEQYRQTPGAMLDKTVVNLPKKYSSLAIIKTDSNEKEKFRSEMGSEHKFNGAIESRLRFLYRKVLDRLINNPTLVNCIKEALGRFDEQRSQNVVSSKEMERCVSDLLLIPRASNGLSYFARAIKELRSLMRLRLLSDSDNLTSRESKIKQILFKTVVTQKKIDELKSRMHEKQASEQLKYLTNKSLIEQLEVNLEEKKADTDSKLLKTVRDLETVKIIQGKEHVAKMCKNESELDAMQKRLEFTLTALHEGFRGLRAYRNELDKELRRIVHEYDAIIIKKQETLDSLNLEEKDNEREVNRLQDVYKDVEERYEEMRATKRLKELLQSLQMAESVKENWAARRIQAAWKRYKTRQLRKRRFKKGGGKKKKKKAGEQDEPKKVGPTAKKKTSFIDTLINII